MPEERLDNQQPELVEQLPDIQPRVGAWAKFPEMYRGPSDVIKAHIRAIRFNPSIFLPQEPLPKDVKRGEPLPLELEVKALLKSNMVGDNSLAMVTNEELLSIASQLWGLDDERLLALRKEILPSAQEWLDQQSEQEKRKWGETQEAKDRFLLEAWNTDRMDLLTDLVATLPSNQVANVEGLAGRYKNLQRPIVEALGTELEAVAGVEDENARREQVHALADRLRDVVGQLTYLAPDEIEEVNGNEQQKGFVFLDTFKDIYPELYRSAALAKKRYQAIQIRGVSNSQGEEVHLLQVRNEAKKKLVYGAKNNRSVRSLGDKLLRRGEKVEDIQRGLK
jgi:hypothetical protein